MIRSNVELKAMLTALAIATAIPTAGTAAPPAQTPAGQAESATSHPAAITIAALITGNESGGGDQLYDALAPRLLDDPHLAQEVIAFAQANPGQIGILAEILARIQIELEKTDSEKAEIIKAIVASAPPVFQAIYANIIAPENNVANAVNEQPADDANSSQQNQARTYSYMPSSSGGSAGFGGGLVSPN